MATLFDKVGPVRDGLTLDDAERENLDWDVFVSHRSDDIDEALSIAQSINRGLTTFIWRTVWRF